MQPTVAPVVMAVVIRRQKKIVAAFRDAGAVSKSTAVTPASLKVEEKRPFHHLKRQKVLRDGGGGRYYFDSVNWTKLLARRRRRAIVAVAAFVGALLGVLIFLKLFR